MTNSQSSRIRQISITAPILLYFAINQTSNWPFLRFWGFRGKFDFIDAKAILFSADCYEKIGTEIYQQGNNYCSNYIYGSTLVRILDFIELGHKQTLLFGMLGIVVISMLLGYLLASQPIGITALLIGFLTVFSPPIMLLLERGNFDWVMITMIFAASFFKARGKEFTAFIILTFSALMKFYSFPLLIWFVIFTKSRKKRVAYLTLAICVLVQIYFDLNKLNSINVGKWDASFGNIIWSNYLRGMDVDISSIPGLMIGFVFTLSLMYLFYLNRTRVKLKIAFEKVGSTFGYFSTYSLVTFVSCYFAGINFDYRLFFLLPLPYFLNQYPNSIWKTFSFILFGLIFWLSFNVGQMQIVGDVLINLVVAALVLEFVYQENLFERFRRVLGLAN